MAINEEEVKIRERLTSLETKLTFIQSLLQEIRDELKDQPTKEEFQALELRVSFLEKTQTSLAIKVGVGSGLVGVIAGLLIKFFMG
jgi:uncharacterized coiled-coil protein SlyX